MLGYSWISASETSQSSSAAMATCNWTAATESRPRRASGTSGSISSAVRLRQSATRVVNQAVSTSARGSVVVLIRVLPFRPVRNGFESPFQQSLAAGVAAQLAARGPGETAERHQTDGVRLQLVVFGDGLPDRADQLLQLWVG